MAGLIACKDVSLFHGFLCSWRPPSMFYKLLEMDRILCVVRGWTDDSRRGVDGTTHKINWTKPLGHGGSPFEEWKVSWRGWQVGLA